MSRFEQYFLESASINNKGGKVMDGLSSDAAVEVISSYFNNWRGADLVLKFRSGYQLPEEVVLRSDEGKAGLISLIDARRGAMLAVEAKLVLADDTVVLEAPSGLPAAIMHVIKILSSDEFYRCHLVITFHENTSVFLRLALDEARRPILLKKIPSSH